SLLATRASTCCGCTPPWKLTLRWCATNSTPGSAATKSVCQDLRRFSPSVMDLRPTCSCFTIRISISRSSIALSSSAVIALVARLARASLSAAERSRLPTWSARNGGLVRCMLLTYCPSLAPNLFRKLGDHPQLRPLLVFREDVALLGRGE